MGERDADDAARVAQHEGDLLGCDRLRGEHEISLVLPTGVVHQDDHASGPQLFEHFRQRGEGHGGGSWGLARIPLEPTGCPLGSRAFPPPRDFEAPGTAQTARPLPGKPQKSASPVRDLRGVGSPWELWEGHDARSERPVGQAHGYPCARGSTGFLPGGDGPPGASAPALARRAAAHGTGDSHLDRPGRARPPRRRRTRRRRFAPAAPGLRHRRGQRLAAHLPQSTRRGGVGGLRRAEPSRGGHRPPTPRDPQSGPARSRCRRAARPRGGPKR